LTTQTDVAELREVEKRPFGIYAIIALLLLGVAAAALDIVRVRAGFPSLNVQRVAEFLQDASSLAALSNLFIRQRDLLILTDIVIIMLLTLTVVGLWFRLREAWILTMIVIGLGLVFNIWNYLEDTPQYINMLIHVVAVFYLNERTVQLAYERRQRGETAAPPAERVLP